jgi:ribonuclease III
VEGRTVSSQDDGVHGQPDVPEELLIAAEAAVGHRFGDRALLGRALTHASVAEERTESNERMEFLGDSVLGAVVAERIYHHYPALLEGEMTKIKSTVVSRQTCAAIARSLGLDELLVIGKGMQQSETMPHSLAAAVLESVIAAIYLDGGYAAAQQFIGPLLDPYIQRAAVSGHQENFKSVLQQHAQQNDLETPLYRVLDEKGPDHAKCFKVAVEIGARRFSASWGQSKKQAEQSAALAALMELGLVQQNEDGHILVIDDK